MLRAKGHGERGGYDLLKGRLISWGNPRFFFAGTALDSKSEKRPSQRSDHPQLALFSRSSAGQLYPGSARTRNYTRARFTGRNRRPACVHGRERKEAKKKKYNGSCGILYEHTVFSCGSHSNVCQKLSVLNGPGRRKKRGFTKGLENKRHMYQKGVQKCLVNLRHRYQK